MTPKPLALLKQLKGLDLKEITKRAEMHDEIGIKTLEIVDNIQKNLREVVEKLGLKYIEIEVEEGTQ